MFKKILKITALIFAALLILALIAAIVIVLGLSL